MLTRLLGSPTARHDRRGAVVVLALFSVVIIVGFAASFLQISSLSAQRQVGAVDVNRAFYLADAGLAESYRGLTVGKTGVVGTEAEPAGFGNGLFWVETTALADGRVQLDSTGMVGGSRVVLSLVAEPGDTTTAGLAVFTAEDLTLEPGTRIDSYDSREGPYAEQKGEDARIQGAVEVGSNGDVSVSGTEALPTLVRGDLSPGPAKTLTTTDHVYVSGETASAPAPQVLPLVELPGTAKVPGVDYNGAVPLVVAAGQHGADFLHIGQDSEVVLQGPMTLLLGGLRVANGGQLTADTTAGAVEVFVENYVELQKGSLVANTSGEPGEFVVQYAGTAAATLYTSVPLVGVFYAPLASIALGRGAELFGSLVGKELVLGGAATVHFDRALIDMADQLSLPKIMTWRIVDMGQTGGGVVDPFQFLGVNRALLPAPSVAHEDQQLDLAYTDLGGTTQTYNGWESGFDWTQVRSVESVARDGKAVSDPDARGMEAPLTATEEATKEYMNEVPANTSTDIKTRLLAESPLSVDLMVEAVRVGILSSADLKDVLLNESPLDPAILTMVLDGSAPLTGLDKAAVMASN